MKILNGCLALRGQLGPGLRILIPQKSLVRTFGLLPSARLGHVIIHSHTIGLPWS